MHKYLISIIVTSIFFISSCNADNKSHTFKINNKVQLTFIESDFSNAEDKPTDCGDGYICLINNKPFWGSDGKVPKTSLSRAYVTIKNNTIELDTTGMYNPLISDSNKSQYTVTHYFDDAWKVRGQFSDGAGSYFAEWLINKTGSIRILIGDSELLDDAFNSIKSNK